MPTKRLYFDDAYADHFTARVVSVLERDGATEVVLDRTLFYPEGGGQPADHGRLDGAPVVDVQEEAGVVRHVLRGRLPEVGAEVRGEIDFARRFDHMQQHTGQHLLSALLLRRFGTPTLSFHLGRERSTIDVERAPLTDEEREAVEEEAATIVREGRRVVPTLHDDPADLPPARRPPPDVAGPFRLLTIEGVDACPCGGTHVRTTTDVEGLALVSQERVKGGLLRIGFLCGGRVRRDHRRRIATFERLVRALSVEEVEVASAAERLVERVRAAEKEARACRAELLPFRADALVAAAERRGRFALVVTEVDGSDRGAASTLGTALERRGDVAAVLVAKAGAKLAVVCVAPREAELDAAALLRALVAAHGGSGGGGRTLAQGGVPDANAGPALLAAGRAALAAALGG